MSLSKNVRYELKERLWHIADEIDWMSLPDREKSRYYEEWSRDEEIGGVLRCLMDQNRVRVYLKDSLMKGYSRDRLADPQPVIDALGLEACPAIVESYAKPHGFRMEDGRVVCWGRAEEWKSILMSLHELSYGDNGRNSFAAVFRLSNGRFAQEPTRKMISDAAAKLGIDRVIWMLS